MTMHLKMNRNVQLASAINIRPRGPPVPRVGIPVEQDDGRNKKGGDRTQKASMFSCMWRFHLEKLQPKS